MIAEINISKVQMKKFLSVAFNLGLKGCGDLESDCIDSILNEVSKIKEGFGFYSLEELRSLKKGTVIVHKTMGRGVVVKSGRSGFVMFNNGQNINFSTSDHPWDKEIQIILESVGNDMIKK